MYKPGLLACLLVLLAASPLFAEDPPLAEEPVPAEDEFAPAPAPPVLPPQVESGEPIEPEIRIIRREDAVIEEYRIHGRLYMVKVTPVVGPSYYLVDRTGDGRMDTRMSDLQDDFIVPQWVIFRW